MFACAETREAGLYESEYIEWSDREQGRRVADEWEKSFSFIQDGSIDDYLRKTGKGLLEKTEGLQESPLQVYAIRDPGPKWTFLGIPGAKIYLSIRFLQAAEYENILAAAMAVEIGKIQTRYLPLKLEELKKETVDWKQAQNQISLQDWSEAAKIAVKIMYFSGYDPRGLVSFWKLLENNIKHSPLDGKSLNYLTELTYEEISAYPPLIRPVVRSDEFLKMKKQWSRSAVRGKE